MSDFALIRIKSGEELISVGHKHITGYKVKLIDLDGDGAGTSEDGYTIRDIRRRNKAKLTVRFDGLTRDEFSAVMSAISPTEFELTFYDGDYRTITAHTGDRDYELIKAASEQDSRWRLDVSFIEY